MTVTRSNFKSDVLKTEDADQKPSQSIAESGGLVDNELFVPLAGPLPVTIPTADETHKATTPEAPKSIKIVQRRKRKAPVPKPGPESSPATKKKVMVGKPGLPETDDPDFIKTKPDAATTMGFPLPKINHGGTRPSRVPRHLYPPLPITEEMMDDAHAIETLLQDLLVVREALDWDCRRLGRRLWLVKRKAALEEQREDAHRLKLWEHGDEPLLEFIKRLEEENMKLDEQEFR